MLIYVPINPTSIFWITCDMRYLNASQKCVRIKSRIFVWRQYLDIVNVCYPHQNILRTYSNDYEFNTFHSSSFLDIFTSEKCHQNFRFATSYPVSSSEYFANVYNVQPYIVRYQHGFSGFQDSMGGNSFDCEIHKSSINQNLPFANEIQQSPQFKDLRHLSLAASREQVEFIHGVITFSAGNSNMQSLLSLPYLLK